MLPLPALAAVALAVPVASFVTLDQARPVVAALRYSLPAELAGLSDPGLAARWPRFVRERDRAVRERLRTGERDAVVNLLFFGTSFTDAPRLTAEGLVRMGQAGAEAALARRIDDLLTALVRPGGDERLALARSALGVAGATGSSAARRRAAELPLLEAVARAQREQTAFARELARIRELPDADAQLAARSTLFQDRGIALDTSLRPAFAVEQGLRGALARGLLRLGGVRRVAVVGPGLDFVEKAEGQDFYPPQSLQCLAVADTLVRLGLASRERLSITAFDVSEQVLDHLQRARARAESGSGYVVQLPRPRQGWGDELTHYWEIFGSEVGMPAEPVRPPATAGDLLVRAVRVDPPVVAAVRPLPLNVVYQRLALPEAERFDLVVATNVLVYYDAFEQALALANIGAMTAPGGLLVANSAVPDFAGAVLRPAGSELVVFSPAPEDGEHMLFYRRAP